MGTSFSYANGEPVSMYTLGISDNDVSANILKTLFGGMPIFGEGEDPFQNIFKIFNFVVIFIGGILATYTYGIGVISTAKEGKTLGKYSSTMTPIRTAWGVAAVLPVFNGYSLIQVGVMYLILQGVAISNGVWATFASNETLAQSLAVAPVQPNARELAKNVLIASMCMSTVQKRADLDGDKAQMGWTLASSKDKKIIDIKGNELAKYIKDNPTKEVTINAGDASGNIVADNACGSITIHSVAEGRNGWFDGLDKNRMAGEVINGATGIYGAANSDSIKGKIGGAAIGLYSIFRMGVDSYKEKKEWRAWLNDMSIEHAFATEDLLYNARIVSDAIVAEAANDIAKNNQKWVNEVNSVNQKQSPEEIPALADVEGVDNETFKKENTVQQSNAPKGMHVTITNDNVLSEGEIKKRIDALASKYQTYFRQKAARSYKDGLMYDTIIKQSNEYGWMMAGAFFVQMGGMSDAINQIALNTPVSESKSEISETLKNKYFNSDYMSKLNYYMLNSEEFKNDAFRVNTLNKPTDTKVANAFERFWNSGLNASNLIDGLTKSTLDTAISDQEHPIMQLKRLGGLMISSGTAVLTYMTTTMAQNNGGGLMFLISLFGYTLIVTLFTGGITLSYVLPMLPVLVWLGMCFGWLVMVIQAMIATPLWAVMHLSPHQGEEFAGAQKNGYMLLLTLIVRPLLMTLGYISAVLTITVIGFFINQFFIFIYSMSQVGTNGFAATMLGAVVVPLMYAAVVYVALKEMLNIMHKVPDELLNWFGGNGTALGGYAQNMSGQSVQVFGMMNNNIGRPFDAMRHNLAEARGAKAQEQSNIADERRAQEAKDEKRLASLSGAGGSVGGTGVTDGTSDTQSYGQGNGSQTSGTYGMSGETGYNTTTMWADGMKDGLLEDNNMQAAHGRNNIFNASNSMINDAVRETLDDIRDARTNANRQGEDFAPVSNLDFANRVNQKIMQKAFGSNAANMNALHSLVTQRSGADDANVLMRDTFNKISRITERTGGDYEDVARKVSSDLNDAVYGFMNNSNINDYNSFKEQYTDQNGVTRVKDEFAFDRGSKHSDNQTEKEMYYNAGKIRNGWKMLVNGKNANEEQNDKIEYVIGKGFQYAGDAYKNDDFNNQSLT